MSQRQPFLDILEAESLIAGRFENLERLDPNGGNGAFSLLFKAIDRENGNKVALKFFDPNHAIDKERLERFDRECEMLQKFSYEKYVINNIGGKETFVANFRHDPTGVEIPITFQFIAIELADGSVEDFIYSNGAPSALHNLICFKELIKSVFSIHRGGVCHRDIKPSNFLLIGHEVRLSDLGTAKCLNGTMPEIRTVYVNPVGDLRYVAPEQHFSLGLADEYAFEADMFSLGAILFEMFTFTRLTSQIYSRQFIVDAMKLRTVLSQMNDSKRKQTCTGILDDLENKTTFPDIYAYNDFVPKCIRKHINKLYKKLTLINYTKRLYNPISMHRIIDICILTLRNEMQYQQWLKNKNIRRQASIQKKQKRLEDAQC